MRCRPTAPVDTFCRCKRRANNQIRPPAAEVGTDQLIYCLCKSRTSRAHRPRLQNVEMSDREPTPQHHTMFYQKTFGLKRQSKKSATARNITATKRYANVACLIQSVDTKRAWANRNRTLYDSCGVVRNCLFCQTSQSGLTHPHLNGLAGKLVVYKSGRVRFVLNPYEPAAHMRESLPPGACDPVHFNVSLGVPMEFTSKVAVVQTAASSAADASAAESGSLIELASLNGPRVVVSVPAELSEPHYHGAF